MKRLSLLVLALAVLSMVFFLLLVFLRTPFSLFPLMSYQDVADLLTPLVLVPVYWLMFRYASSRAEETAFMALGLPFAVLVTLLTFIWGRKKLARQPLLAFFFVACLVAVVLFGGWGLYWGGFPQFTDVGLI